MDKYPKKTIGELCHIEKGVTGLASAEPGPYPLVATSLERKSCNTYQFDTRAVCIPLVSSTGHGKKTLNYVHYQEGKFALGTILAAVIPKDAGMLSAGFLHRYLQFFKETKLVSLMKGAANVSLAVKDIAKIEIPVPPIEEQIKFIELFNKANNFGIQLVGEFNTQSNYLKQLRQSILQEAIEGKLTADWRKTHPVVKGNPDFDAEALLDAVKAEKMKLVSDSKFKKDKSLSKVFENESLFNLPEGWNWSRLGDVSNFIDYRGKTPRKIESGIRLITAKNVKKGYLSLTPEEFISEKEYKQRMTRGYPIVDDIFFTTEAPLGNVCLNNLTEQFAVGQRIITIRPLIVLSKFMYLVLLSPIFQKQIDARKTGLTAKGIKSSKLIEVPLMIPSLKEQRAIVERVDSLLAMVDLLEKQVNERKVMADELMQSVLREAFG